MKTPIARLSRDQRFNLYKKALEIISQNNEEFKDNVGFGLCLALPCLHWDLKTCYDKNPETGESWDYESSRKWFPEIKPFVDYVEAAEEVDLDLSSHGIELKRIEFLTKLIANYEKES